MSTTTNPCEECGKHHPPPVACVRCGRKHRPCGPGAAKCKAEQWAEEVGPAGVLDAALEVSRGAAKRGAAKRARIADLVTDSSAEAVAEMVKRMWAMFKADGRDPAEAVAEMLRAVEVGDGRHALAVVHGAWPQEVEPDVIQHPHAGILPGPLAGAAVNVQVRDRSDDLLPGVPGPVEADGDGWLPGYEPGPGPLARVPVLDFLHAAGLAAFQPGKGAPWPLRIAYEALIDVPAAARNGGIARLEYPLSGDGDATLRRMLWPDSSPRFDRNWPAFLAALEVVDRFTVPADDGASSWRPILVRSYPNREGGVLRLDVSLPPGSDRGARILRRILRRLGARSYPQWRAWLALAYLWDRSAVNGHWIRATRPRVARDSAGRVVDATGAALLNRGAPVTKWTDKRAVLLDADGRPVKATGDAAREPNPEARLHPWLIVADIVALGYPPERKLSGSAVRMRKVRMLTDLETFDREGLAVLEAHPDGRRWRVLPPGEDPA